MFIAIRVATIEPTGRPVNRESLALTGPQVRRGNCVKSDTGVPASHEISPPRMA
jgi:hypothetical protein